MAPPPFFETFSLKMVPLTVSFDAFCTRIAPPAPVPLAALVLDLLRQNREFVIATAPDTLIHIAPPSSAAVVFSLKLQLSTVTSQGYEFFMRSR